MKILITDDELPARERLQRLLKDITSEHEVVGEAFNGTDALEKCHNLHPDLVLMDIRMPGMDGLEAAMHLSRLENPPAIIFVTAYDEHALEAFESHAVDYLLKPIRKERLEKALEKAGLLTRVQLSKLGNSREEGPKARGHICVQVRGNLKLIPVSDIIYFRAEQKYVCVRYNEGEVLIEEPLKDLEIEFSNDFMRIHRNALIALDKLDGLEKQGLGRFGVKLSGIDYCLEVSRRHVASVRKLLKTGKS
ncbi:MAG: response regulator transcription factor [Methylococcales bacterium]|jgi:two-component system, LytTR family, response regulator AlgR|nr:response regulator transcription factor [Methylococcales bacterium]